MNNNNIKFKVYTSKHECYNIMDNGDIQRTDMMHIPSGQWKFKGISHVKKSWFIPFNEITKELITALPMLYKNRKPQFTVRDLDHGTTREWGNNGVTFISFT